MSKSKITEVTSKIVDLLDPLDSTERQRVIQASLLLLGDAGFIADGGNAIPNNPGSEPLHTTPETSDLPRQVQTWMKQNNLSKDMLDQVFHISDGTIDVIASDIPGDGLGDKTVNTYILQGLSQFILTGEANFEDKGARALAKTIGCFNEGNHAKYMKGAGNKLTGDKTKGWKLTSPGLKYGAELIQQIVS